MRILSRLIKSIKKVTIVPPPGLRPVRIWQPGEVILGTYQVEDVKVGGMGYVYIAEHKRWKVKLAIKSPNEMMLSDRSYFARVLREADTWIRLGLYPHIASCYYVRQIDDVPHIFIEYVDGGNLREWVADLRCYDMKVGLEFAIQFCRGMEYAHQFGVIHRDLKPENILISKEGILKVTDFGVARRYAPDEPNGPSQQDAPQATGEPTRRPEVYGTQLAGTYDYMSPEQYTDAHNVDERTDIFSFGVCLYEMLCGRKPFDSVPHRPASVTAQKESKPLYEPTSLRADIPPKLSALLKRCCALNPDARFSSFKNVRLELVDVYTALFQQYPPHTQVEAITLKADGLNNRAVSYLDLGQEKEAISCWQQALKEDSQHLESNFNYGFLRWQKGEITDDAYLTQLGDLQESKRSDADYWRCLAWVHVERGDLDALERMPARAQLDDEELKKALEDRNKPVGRLLRTFRPATDNQNSSPGTGLGGTLVCFSPDGQHAVSAGPDTALRLWRLDSGTVLQQYVGHEGAIHAVCFSPDGRHILSGSEDQTITLWDLATASVVQQFVGHTNRVYSVCFSPSGRFVISGSWDRTIRLWDVRNGKEVKQYRGHSVVVNSVQVSPDGHYILSGGGDSLVRLWRLESGAEVRQFQGHNNSVSAVCISPDGRTALSGGFRSIHAWDLRSGKELQRLGGHTGWVTSVCFSPDGRYALSGSEDQTIRLWEIETGRQLRRFAGHTGWVNSVCFSPAGNFALSGGSDQTIRYWQVSYPGKQWHRIHPFPLLCRVKAMTRLGEERESARKTLKSAKNCIWKRSFERAYAQLRETQSISGFERDREVMDLLTLCALMGKGQRTSVRGAWSRFILEGHSIRDVSFSPEGRYAISASFRTVGLWDVETGRMIKRFSGHSDFVESVCFSPDGRRALSGGWDRALFLWDIQSGKKVNQFVGHTGWIYTASFIPDGQYALSAGGDHTIRLWDLDSGEEVSRFEVQTNTVNSICFSPKGSYVLSGTLRSIQLWDVPRGKKLSHLVGHTGWITALCFSPDGRQILSGSEDQTLRLWDRESGVELQRLVGHTSAVTAVCFSNDGRYALSGDKDKSVRLWDVQSGTQLRRFVEHTGQISSVCFSPDGRYALVGSEDNRSRLWEIDWEFTFQSKQNAH